ncbi:hypothetical protein K435DRAFT_870402 [Dendrothele bispora CBS 962.96]|uniref:Uncharacterized protein n=1 Tax=Dendrothele bispora (strain CBS 962.96) TaxID=1314807 RepID=A0A4S8L6S6_DENBC|nr:hypothetical protein K435DRAFT_870402 [Dendrothele bispora CBS 962.96]
MYALDNSSLASVGSEELHWLHVHASLLQQEPEPLKPTPVASIGPSYQRSTKSSNAKSVLKRPSLQNVTVFPSPQEWICRSPKSATLTPPRKRPFPSTPHYDSSASSSPTKFWTTPPSRSSSSKTDESPSIPSIWFGAGNCHSPTSPTKPKRSASSSGPPRTRPKKPTAVRSGSVSSVSSAMSSPPHTPTTPVKPLNSSFKKFEPHHRCIMECDEDGDNRLLVRGSPTKGILAPSRIHRSPSSQSQSGTRSSSSTTNTRTGHGRKISIASTATSCCTSSSSATTSSTLASSVSSHKSVKFVDTPTVHYANVTRFSYGDYSADFDGSTPPATELSYGDFGYGLGEDWGGDPFSNYMGVERDRKQQVQVHPYARVTGVLDEEDEEETDESGDADVEGMVTEDDDDDDDDDDEEDDGAQFREFMAKAKFRESLCKTPTPDSSENVERRSQAPNSPSNGLKRLISLKRKSSIVSSRTTTTTTTTTTAAVPRSPRPKAQSTSHAPGYKRVISGPYALGSAHHHPANLPGVRSAPVLRSSPSVESFKSAGVKSSKSVRSLKSLPESIKSSLSLRAKGMREWLKGRVTIGG